MLKNKKGISLISLIITIVVMLIITSMLIYTGINNSKVEKIAKMRSDIDLLQGSVSAYYLRNNTLPIEHENELKKVLNPNEIIPQLGSERSEDDNDVYYILEISLLENITLSNATANGTFIINEQSHIIYYIEGIVMDGVTYYTLPEEGITGPTIRITPNSRAGRDAIEVVITLLGPAEFKTDNIYEYYVSDSKSETIGGTWKTYTKAVPFLITSPVNATKYIHVKSVTDVAGQVSGAKVSGKFTFNYDAPIVIFNPNGDLNYKKTQSTKVTVTGVNGGIIDTNSLKYQWSQSTTVPQENTFTEQFTNGKTISKSATVPEEWYLWIFAQDTAGNKVIQRSELFCIGPVVPRATITADKPAGKATNATTINYTFTWIVDVTNFSATGVTVTNGTKGTFTKVNNRTYTLSVTTGIDQCSNLDVFIPANVCTDADRNE